MDTITYALLLNKLNELQIDISNIPTPLTYKGSVASADLLPKNPKTGHMYNIESKSVYGEKGMNVAWNDQKWDSLGAAIDMSLYYTKTETDSGFSPISRRIEMTNTDTEVSLNPDNIYVFPEISSLSITLLKSGHYHFIFTSGATPTILTLPSSVKSDLFIESNRIYEISILENLVAWNSWAV